MDEEMARPRSTSPRPRFPYSCTWCGHGIPAGEQRLIEVRPGDWHYRCQRHATAAYQG